MGIATKLAAGAAIVLGTVSASAGPCTKEIQALTRQLAASDAGTGPTGGSTAPTAGQQKGQHPGTSLMDKETRGRATAPGDVRRQTGIRAEASKELARARTLDARGKEAECMSAVKSAKELARR